jgi:hypothetical protein
MTHKHHHHDECCEHEHSNCCHTHDSCCHENEEDRCEFSEQLLEMADEAWMELVKEKIKEQIQATSGKKLDELAKLVNETNHERWGEFFAEKRTTENFKSRLREYFHSSERKKK